MSDHKILKNIPTIWVIDEQIKSSVFKEKFQKIFNFLKNEEKNYKSIKLIEI